MQKNELNYSVAVQHCDGSRIMNAIIKHLKKNEALKVNTFKTPLHLRMADEYVHEYSIDFKNKSQPNKLCNIKNEIISAIPELFPINYFFKIQDVHSTFVTFGYKHEGSFHGIDGNYFHIYSKIKEQKSNSAEITTYKIEV